MAGTFTLGAEDHADLPLVLHVRLVAIYISSGHDYWAKQDAGRLQHGIQKVTEVECVANRGLKGDRYYEKKPEHIGQVTFLDADVVQEVRQLFHLPASIFRRNLLIQGAHLKDLVKKRFLFQGIEFEDFLKLQFRGGLRARIVTSGVLRIQPGHGDTS